MKATDAELTICASVKDSTSGGANGRQLAANCRHTIGNIGRNKADVQGSILDVTAHRASIGSCRHWRHPNRPYGCGQHDTRERNAP
jgi:hypothetical protein